MKNPPEVLAIRKSCAEDILAIFRSYPTLTLGDIISMCGSIATVLVESNFPPEQQGAVLQDFCTSVLQSHREKKQ